MMTRDEFLEVMGRVYDDVQRLGSAGDNRHPDEASHEIAGMLGEAMVASGVTAVFHTIFRQKALNGAPPVPDEDLSDRQLLRGAGYLWLLVSGLMPGDLGRAIASDLAMLGEGVKPARIARAMGSISSSLATDAGTLSVTTAMSGAAHYKAARDGVKDWLPAHREILPPDENDLPSDKTRREWEAMVKPEVLEQFRLAGEARRQIGDGELPANLAAVETWAISMLESPEANAVQWEFVKAEKQAKRR